MRPYISFKIIDFLLWVLLLLLLACTNKENEVENKNYLRWVGDSVYQAEMDDANFSICHSENNVFQYFNLGKGPLFPDEKKAVLNTFNSKFNSEFDSTQNGYIRIRFVVNCKGESGRFRMIQSNFNYETFQFKEEITSQLLNITKQIKPWRVLSKNKTPVDYYMYLIFRLENGQLKDIAP